jgi:hypothetical protein
MATDSRSEHIFVIVLCILAAARVFVYSAAFPCFNNVDEQMHFDLVYKYSVGHVPKQKIENYSRQAAELIVLYGTPEYFHGPAGFPDGRVPPPPWKIPNVRSTEEFDRAVSNWQKQGNHETTSFPVYYTVAGLWSAAGRAAGLRGGHFLYWIRFLNIVLFAALVYLSYLIGRTLAADNPVQRLGLPVMTAFFPQDVFYSINSDALSPLLFAISFFMLLQLYFENRSILYHALAGSAVAGCFLVKVSNLAVLVLLGFIAMLKVRDLLAEGRLPGYLTRLLVLILTSLAPIGLWLARNYFLFRDITGSAHKAEYLGWRVKPLGQVLDHPIFTVDGILTFLRGVTETFWRGEFVWHLEPIRLPWMDIFYVFSSAVFMGASLLALLPKRAGTNKKYRYLIAMSLGTVVLSVLLLAALSVPFDFGDCWFPSRESPYFLAGRLISCCLLPFLILYVDGLGRLTWRRKKPALALVILSLIAIGVTLSELFITLNVFSSQYNWFHLKS